MTQHRVAIGNEQDVVAARQLVRSVAADEQFSLLARTRLATAVSELARNIVRYAGGSGQMEVECVREGGRSGIRCVFTDRGPGIADVDLAMQEGFSTGRSLGQGLPGARRLVDQLSIESEVGVGTQITIVAWR
ncbi:MAG: anti-sigma regulatory factor [Deltaproteobacteria bacterium]|nr:anti-sigma regulatory factor [Deltaproteobacteria bacterium]